MFRYFIAALILLSAQIASAAIVHVPAESLAPVNEDDWSIPLRRCLRHSEAGAAVYDGAERCTVEFAVPLPVGSRLEKVRVLYEDGTFTPEIELTLQVRDVTSGHNLFIAHDKDFSAGTITKLNTLKLEPGYELGLHDAAFVLAEVRGDTRLLTLSYEYGYE